MMLKRTLWSGQDVPALGLGCWAIGGPFFAGDQPLGWGTVDDSESIRAIHAAYDMGIRFFDTSDAYGTGHSEEILGKALTDRPDAVIATKFGNTYDRATRQLTGLDVSTGYIRYALDASLSRLGRDRVNLYQLHVDTLGDDAGTVHDALVAFADEGRIEAFGWSTDTVSQASRWPVSPLYAAVQHALNVVTPATELLALCNETHRLSINRSPLAMGVLTAKFDSPRSMAKDDIRAAPPGWLKYFKDGRPDPTMAEKVNAVRELLRSGGRTLAQGALAWIWAQSPQTLPIPGFRTVAQVSENARALDYGPLPQDVVTEIRQLLSRLAPDFN
jgi:aryl-alcohol dehydrogenase-like predicted oxidoreductase